jgi:hypothetical protein
LRAGSKRKAAVKPTSQTTVATQNTRLFQTPAVAHRSASAGSLGHCWGRIHNIQAVIHSSNAETENIQASYSASVTSTGSELVSEATTAPNPRLTNKIGRAQHSSVPVEASSVIQLMLNGLAYVGRHYLFLLR